ncbi:hypothetical protein BOTBODRAFT_34036 [Botryobasidium botryosum FD-172 SS1]|uniref:NAD(P)-binding protein n=1 Tax=Botryobasidium botryosum (strain FD-172 SS1) TaxID=930990 RepID=A0A067MM08_BOTB1|nr:hypothetical protein BOTBODRAFT_34036 [Botryobasidium botryosum FD-172 SS1]
MTATVYLITGANRGIGYSLVHRLSTRSNTTIYAGARNPAQATALHELSAKSAAKIVVVKLDSLNTQDPKDVAKQIEKEEGKVDVVIANAGIAKYFGPLTETPLSEFQDHFDVNTKGPIVLFQATHALLEKSNKPTFVLLSTTGASIDTAVPFPVSAYGTSKIAANFVVARIHAEHPKFIAFAVHPGFTNSDMGNEAAEAFGMEKAPNTLEETSTGIVKLIDEGKREEKVKFWDFEGNTLGW